MRLLAWQSMKPDLFYPNVKYVYTVWIIPYPLYSAICAIHRTENTENTNPVYKWAISTGALASIYSVERGRL